MGKLSCSFFIYCELSNIVQGAVQLILIKMDHAVYSFFKAIVHPCIIDHLVCLCARGRIKAVWKQEKKKDLLNYQRPKHKLCVLQRPIPSYNR